MIILKKQYLNPKYNTVNKSVYATAVLFLCNTVVTCKIKNLQNICKNALVFILHVTTSKNVLHQKFAKTLQNIFSRIEHGLKIDSGYV